MLAAVNGFASTYILCGGVTATTAVIKYQESTTLTSLSLRYGTANPPSTGTIVAATQLTGNITFNISSLTAGQTYYYQFSVNGAAYGSTRHFVTARPAGTSFRFVILSDEHINVDPDAGEIAAIKALKAIFDAMSPTPDFILNMGDLVTLDGVADVDTEAEVLTQYLTAFDLYDALEYPAVFVPGNHEYYAGSLFPAYQSESATYLPLARYGRNLLPLYSSTATSSEYFTFTWGDAKFVAVSPFPYTLEYGAASMVSHEWSLGSTQAAWLKSQVQSSGEYMPIILSHTLNYGCQLVADGCDETADPIGKTHYGRGIHCFDFTPCGVGTPFTNHNSEFLDSQLANGKRLFYILGHDHLFASTPVTTTQAAVLSSSQMIRFLRCPRPISISGDWPETYADYWYGADGSTYSKTFFGFVVVDVDYGGITYTAYNMSGVASTTLKGHVPAPIKINGAVTISGGAAVQ